MVVRNVARIVVVDLSWCVGEMIPNGFALAMFVPAAFDLIRSRGGTPDKFLWEVKGVFCHVVFSFQVGFV
jgi:hypothetical protein